ncbi:MAG: phosphate/phosphite/phosphonate ABC transporter substrate-binding protein [Anaerolineae bacterium]|nr:MAG: phosphate/phosphite/phosphonate ABC transporter substrate-binding protein [Anaerolineae bacterium]
MNRKTWLVLIVIVVALATMLAGCKDEDDKKDETPESTEVTPTGIISVGDISDNPTEKIAIYQALADYLGSHLAEFGIGAGEVRIAPDMPGMAAMLANGQLDIYFDSPYPAIIVSNQSGATPVLRRWKGGVEEYHTVIFARADSGLASLEDLKGKAVAFDEPFSTSGYLLPRAFLIEAGFTTTEISNPETGVGAEEIGYVFSGEDQNTIEWVLSGRTAAGVTDHLSYAEIPEETRSQLVILAETENVPRQLAVVRPGLDPELQTAIVQLLMSLDEAEGGAEILQQAEETAQFDEFPQGTDAALARMRELVALVEGS